MRIFLDCRPLQQAGPDSERARFILSCVTGLTLYRGVEWLFLLNGKGVDLALPAGEKILARKSFWLVSRTARKYKADLIMMTDGRKVRSSIPQCSWMPGGSSLRLSSGEDVKVLPAAEERVAALSVEERERIKGAIADGKEYFLSDITGADIAEVVNLLKAFSLFKKRQLSNMKLVLAGKGHSRVTGMLDSYKYRQDVSLRPGGGMEEVIGGAYAMVHMARQDSLGMDVLNAWKAHVPVIAERTDVLAGLLAGDTEAGEAVLQVVAGDPVPLADGLKSLYKDEAFRRELIEKAVVRSAPLTLQRSVTMIWEAIGRN
jgi:hypothetical protein